MYKIILIPLLTLNNLAYAMEIPVISELKKAFDRSFSSLNPKQKQIALYYYLKDLAEKRALDLKKAAEEKAEHLKNLRESDAYKLMYKNNPDPDLIERARSEGEANNDRLCGGRYRDKLSEFGIDPNKALYEFIENKSENSRYMQELICNLCKQKRDQQGNYYTYYLEFFPEIQNSLNLAIKRNSTFFIKLLYDNGFLFKHDSKLPKQGVGPTRQDSPLHILAENSKDHEDPVGMAKLLVSLGAVPQMCNAQFCFDGGWPTDYGKLPHEALYEQIKDDL